MRQIQQLEELAESARNMVSKYCLSECSISCCSNSFSLETYSKHEVKLLLGLGNAVDIYDYAKKDSRLRIKQFWFRDDKYNVVLNPCRFLEGRICKLYNDSRRPEACSQYPVIPGPKIITLVSTCEAIRNPGFAKKIENILNPAISAGYEIAYI